MSEVAGAGAVRILLTGGTGYIGRYVAEACLDCGWEVHLLTRPGSIFPPALDGRVGRHDHQPTFESLDAVLRAVRPECVAHLASAPAGARDPEQVRQTIETNVTLPTLLLEAMAVNGIGRFVNTGTFWQHYRGEAFCPVDFYAATKQAFQDVVRHYTVNRGLAAITLKLFDTYGPDDPRRKIVTLLVDAARKGGDLGMSGGEQILDLTHVADVGRAFAHAIALAMAAPGGHEASYFVSGERMSLKKLARVVTAAAGQHFAPRFGALPYREREIMVPIDPGADLLPGWASEHRVGDMIATLLPGGPAAA